MQALKLTFAPWKEKVVFVEKVLSDMSNNTTTSIDALVNPEPKREIFHKNGCIEGFEQLSLSGMENLVKSGMPTKMAVFTYHYPNDLIEIEEIVKSHGFTWKVSEGFVIFFKPGEEPYFRKLIIQAEKS